MLGPERMQPRASERPLVVFIAHADALQPVISERIHRRDAKSGVHLELLDDLVANRKRSIAAIEVAVGIDEAGDDRLPRHINPRRIRRDVDRGRRPNTLDPAIGDKDCGICNGWHSGPVDQTRTDERNSRR